MTNTTNVYCTRKNGNVIRNREIIQYIFGFIFLEIVNISFIFVLLISMLQLAEIPHRFVVIYVP